MKQFAFKIAGENDVTAKLFFAFSLEALFNQNLDLTAYSNRESVQQLRVEFLSHKAFTGSGREDKAKFRPQSGVLDLTINLDYEVFSQAEEVDARGMLIDFFLLAIEEYIEVEGFDNLALLRDVQSLLASFGNEG